MQRQETGCAFDRVMYHRNYYDHRLRETEKLIQGEALFKGVLEVQKESALNNVGIFFDNHTQYCNSFRQHILRETCEDIAKAGKNKWKRSRLFL